MDRNALIPIMLLAIVNGIFSPFVLGVFVLYPIWFPSWAPPIAPLVYMMSALILSTLTIMLSGVPAALYERMSGSPNPGVTSGIWGVSAAVLTVPALPNVMRALGLG